MGFVVVIFGKYKPSLFAAGLFLLLPDLVNNAGSPSNHLCFICVPSTVIGLEVISLFPKEQGESQVKHDHRFCYSMEEKTGVWRRCGMV